MIQSGTIAAVAGGSRVLRRAGAVDLPTTGWYGRSTSDSYAVSLSTQQLVGIVLVIFLSLLNTAASASAS